MRQHSVKNLLANLLIKGDGKRLIFLEFQSSQSKKNLLNRIFSEITGMQIFDSTNRKARKKFEKTFSTSSLFLNVLPSIKCSMKIYRAKSCGYGGCESDNILY